MHTYYLFLYGYVFSTEYHFYSFLCFAQCCMHSRTCHECNIVQRKMIIQLSALHITSCKFTAAFI